MPLQAFISQSAQEPWHGFGTVLPKAHSVEAWAQRVGMNWRIESAPVLYQSNQQAQNNLKMFNNRRVLFRSDTAEPLSVVSAKYNVVQPVDILELYRDISCQFGYELETAGIVKRGRRIWALANTGRELILPGKDVVKEYLLLATSCDGTLATTVIPTTIRVACSNTLKTALKSAKCGLKISHRTIFDAKAVRLELGLISTAWTGFVSNMRELAKRRVTEKEVWGFLQGVYKYNAPASSIEPAKFNELALKKTRDLYMGAGRGSEMDSSRGTAWGLLNSVTEYVDHYCKSQNLDARLDSGWFGSGAEIKSDAMAKAISLVC